MFATDGPLPLGNTSAPHRSLFKATRPVRSEMAHFPPSEIPAYFPSMASVRDGLCRALSRIRSADPKSGFFPFKTFKSFT